MFTQLPNNYASLYGKLQYQLHTTSSKDITIVINDYNNSECIGVKKFYSTSDLLVNVAPIIRPFAMPTPECQESGFMESNRQGFVTVELEASADDTIIATSTQRTFTLSHSDESSDTTATTMPLQRVLSLGEQDIVTYIGESNDAVEATVTLLKLDGDEYTEIESLSYSGETDYSGIAQFVFALNDATASNGDYIDKVAVEIYQSNNEAEIVEYFISEKTHTATRLAWISSRGFIEHYTFTEIKEQNEKADSAALTLLSAFETYQTRSAVAELIASPQVWVADGGEYVEATVISSSIDTAPFDAVATIEVEIEI